MRSFARAWATLDQIGQHPVAQVPWGYITVLLDKLDDPPWAAGLVRVPVGHARSAMWWSN
ncbi:MAG: hypothetical protein J0I14_14405 [Propionibacteriaceae bacterium]|nr:hypothetical protein [Propionibacteriaceae bacterium]